MDIFSLNFNSNSIFDILVLYIIILLLSPDISVISNLCIDVRHKPIFSF
jgi:hypothetical protein